MPTLGELSLTYPDDYVAEIALSRLLACETILGQTGIPADVSDWIAATVTSDTADAIKQSVKANYPEQQWLTLAKQLRDPLRQEQRDALVAYLLAQRAPGRRRHGGSTPDDVFAHFLIDVEMCSCMATSRIVQATATVQLFVQRCFLGLEPEVTVDASADGDWLQWQWMSQYRVWEANREVFLFPENWIDPDAALRTPRRSSPTCEQISSRANSPPTSAETALENYLEKLEAVARLDVVRLRSTTSRDGKDILRVIARTQGSPAVYYMREWVDSSHWTAWEKVDLDIASDHVLPVVWNGKRYLFWAVVTSRPTRTNQPVPPAQTSTHAAAGTEHHLEVQLAWSQYKQGKWQAKQTAARRRSSSPGMAAGTSTTRVRRVP